MQLTSFTTQFAVNLAVSPDGTTVVFDVWNESPGTSTTPPQDLWIMPRTRSAAPKLFVKNGGPLMESDEAAGPLSAPLYGRQAPRQKE